MRKIGLRADAQAGAPCYSKPTPNKEDTLPQDNLPEQNIPRDLGDGLVMRKATSRDRERLADFHANNLLDIGETGPNEGLHAWMLDLMSGEHPTFRPGDFI